MTGSGVTGTELVVAVDLGGHRVDKVIAEMLGLSRAAARAAIEAGQVMSGGLSLDPAAKVAAGTKLDVAIPARSSDLEPLEKPLAIRYESATVLVVDKPAGLVVHPGAGHRDDTLASVLIWHYPELAELGETHRWGLVHRLDRDTSGLLIVARTAEAHSALQGQLKARQVSRVYLTLVGGTIEPATGTIEAPLGRDPEHPTRMALRQDGRFARTHYRRLAGWDDLALLEVSLDTGRTHQIRVHLASIGTPVAGDRTYGKRRAHRGDPGRVALHAHRLTFQDPGSSPQADRITVVSPLPADLTAAIRSLGEPSIGEVPPDLTEPEAP